MKVLKNLLIVILSLTIVYLLLFRPSTTITKYETKTFRDTLIVVDTVTKTVVLTKEQLVPYETVVVDTKVVYKELCDSLRNYNLTIADNDTAKITGQIQTQGVLTKANFQYTVYPKTVTITEKTLSYETNLFYLGAFASTQPDVYIGGNYLKKRTLFSAYYSPSSNQVLVGVSYRMN